MNLTKKIFNILFSTLLLTAAPYSMASKIFVSNNQKIISPTNAYERMYDNAQKTLENKTINTLQHGHYEEGRMENVLGAYTLSSSQTITADNTLIFKTSPNEHSEKEKIIQTATQLAKRFNQESVAVFIDNNNVVDYDTILTFKGKKPTYKTIKPTLLALRAYGLSAFSIHFQSDKTDLPNARVRSIEWLSSQDNRALLKQYFNRARINEKRGLGLLVYQDGEFRNII